MPGHYNGTPEEIDALDAFIKLTRANSALEARLLAQGKLRGLTVSQFGVLEALYHLGTLCQGVLSQKLLKSTGNITLVLDNLEKRGLARRVRSNEDRRMVLIELTPAGSELIEQILPEHVGLIVAEMAALEPAEQRELGRLCKKLGLGRAGEPSPEEARHESA